MYFGTLYQIQVRKYVNCKILSIIIEFIVKIMKSGMKLKLITYMIGMIDVLLLIYL